ncbi:MAG: sensor histidine kinase, partial [Candidatus Andersenbacteria bacterium]|nr:sensor histidine kinase [Candidatus Andersenbacteria bacterium]
TAAKKQLKIEIKNAETRLPTLLLDSDKIRIALTNVIDNAIKYSKPNGVITISFVLNASTLAVSVADQGIGIPHDQLYRLFTRFFRGRNASLQHTDGSGLGLYIAKTIIEKQGGVISAASQEGLGTTMTITLPTTRKRTA